MPSTADLQRKNFIGRLKAALRLPITFGVPDIAATESRYSCPVCGQKVERFLPLDAFYTENRKRYGNPYPLEDAETLNLLQYLCPKCGCSDRDRLYAIYLTKEFANDQAGKTIDLLDIAPSAPLQRFLRKFPQIRYRSADKYMQGVDLVLDIMDMGEISGGAFDFFICSHVLEHVADDRKALAELFRILRPGGSGILMVPLILSVSQIDEDPAVTDEGERWRRFGQYDHVRLYSKQGFLDRVAAAGFMVNQYGVGFFGAEVFDQHGISSQSILYIVGKE